MLERLTAASKALSLIQPCVLLGSASTPHFDLCINLLIQKNPQNNHSYMLTLWFPLFLSLLVRRPSFLLNQSEGRHVRAHMTEHLSSPPTQRRLKSRCNHLQFKIKLRLSRGLCCLVTGKRWVTSLPWRWSGRSMTSTARRPLVRGLPLQAQDYMRETCDWCGEEKAQNPQSCPQPRTSTPDFNTRVSSVQRNSALHTSVSSDYSPRHTSSNK